jgi:hypothetical protein
MKSRKRKEDGGSGVTGKRPRKQVQELDFDDLESISDGETLPSKDKKATGRNTNGRPKRKFHLQFRYMFAETDQ